MMRSLGAKTLAMPAPVWLVGTYDKDGKPNIMTASWADICCSKPPCVAISLRRATYSYASIEARKAFTISIPSEVQVKMADYVGMASGKDVDKFAVCHLEPVRSVLVDAPYVAGTPLVLECRLMHTLEIGLHTLFVGEILDVKAEESVIDKKGKPDIEKVQPLIFDPARQSYFGIGHALGKAFSIGKSLNPKKLM